MKTNAVLRSVLLLALLLIALSGCSSPSSTTPSFDIPVDDIAAQLQNNIQSVSGLDHTIDCGEEETVTIFTGSELECTVNDQGEDKTITVQFASVTSSERYSVAVEGMENITGMEPETVEESEQPVG